MYSDAYKYTYLYWTYVEHAIKTSHVSYNKTSVTVKGQRSLQLIEFYRVFPSLAFDEP